MYMPNREGQGLHPTVPKPFRCLEAPLSSNRCNNIAKGNPRRPPVVCTVGCAGSVLAAFLLPALYGLLDSGVDDDVPHARRGAS